MKIVAILLSRFGEFGSLKCFPSFSHNCLYKISKWITSCLDQRVSQVQVLILTHSVHVAVNEIPESILFLRYDISGFITLKKNSKKKEWGVANL